MAMKAMPPYFPANEGAAIATSDTDDLPNVPTGGARVFVGTTGDVTVDLAVGGTVTFKNVASGAMLADGLALVKKVYTTGTTAADLVALW